MILRILWIVNGIPAGGRRIREGTVIYSRICFTCDQRSQTIAASVISKGIIAKA